MAIEVNGQYSHSLNGGTTDDDLVEDDLLRTKVLEGAGIRVLNIPVTILKDLETKRTYLVEKLKPLL